MYFDEEDEVLIANLKREQPKSERRRRLLVDLKEGVGLGYVLAGSVAATAWLFRLVGVSWDDWPLLRWLCIAPLLIIFLPIGIVLIFKLFRWGGRLGEQVPDSSWSGERGEWPWE